MLCFLFFLTVMQGHSKTSKTAVLPEFFEREHGGMVAALTMVWQSCLPKIYRVGSGEFTSITGVIELIYYKESFEIPKE